MFRLTESLRSAATFVVLTLAGVQPGCAAAEQTEQALGPAEVARIEKLVIGEMSRDSVPSVSLAVALDNELVWAEAYGMADIENHVPATVRTLYRTASIDKWMTATAVMRLVEEGKLSLDTEASEYCTVFPEKRWPVTVRRLLNHTSGVRHYWGSDEPVKQARERNGYLVRYTDRVTPVSTFKDDPLLFEPGSRFEYTSHGYRLLGCVLVGATGAPYTELMNKLVFGPAELPHTTPDDSWAVIPHRAAGYSLTEDGRLRRASFRDVSENLPAGGHLSRPVELVNFAIAFNTGRLLPRASVEKMLARPTVSDEGDGTYYGFGVNVALPDADKNTTGERVLYHSGSQSGTKTALMLVPSRGIVVAIMMNHDETDWQDIGWPILGMVAGR